MTILRIGPDAPGMIPVPFRGGGALGLPPLDFNEDDSVFTAAMAKRDTSGNVFAASPIVQGDWDTAGTPDLLQLPRGALISGSWYANFDPYQGSIVFWITPEWDGNDGLEHYIFSANTSNIAVVKRSNDVLRLRVSSVQLEVDCSAWTAGTRYCVIGRWDTKNTLDGTNYVCISVGGIHTFGDTATAAPLNALATMHIGSQTTSLLAADAIIEGLTIYRRPLWDGDYGVDVGNGDEVALISAGVDPCTVTGSWGIPLCVPTNAAVGALVTGTGEAWSHPHGSAVLVDTYCETAYVDSAGWADEGTPITPAAYEFDGAATIINCGSNAALDDLASQPAGKGTFTAEAWVRADGQGELNVGRVFDKTGSATRGWVLAIESGAGLRAQITCATTAGYAITGPDDFAPDGRLHHVAMTWDDLTYNYPRIWVDGIEVSYSATQNRVGAVILDNADDFIIGNRSAVNRTWDGKIAWARLSNNIRYASPFVPPPLTNPPAVDGNTIEQWNMQDCAGASATAQVNAGAPPGGCDGQITAGAGGWNCVKDMDDFAIGDRDFQWGYIFGSDAANEGITQTLVGLHEGDNYVLRVPLNLGADSNGRLRVRVRDETNAANIVDFDGPLYTGLHTGANNSATLIVAGALFPQSLIGAEVYNITDVNPAGNDCSHATITAVSGDGTTITAALAGGTDADWDTNDVFRIVWHRTGAGVRSMPADHPWTETLTFELPTIARGAVADCVSISVKVLNSLASGTVMCHQVELQPNLIDNPSLETGAGNPWIPDGWVNDGLDPGDSVASSAGAAIIHSGADCIQFNVGAVSPERIFLAVAFPQDGFACIGCWAHTNGRIAATAVTRIVHQASVATMFSVFQSGTAVWEHLTGVGRGLALARQIALYSQSAQHYVDDVYCVELDDVTLTATAANQADSEE